MMATVPSMDNHFHQRLMSILDTNLEDEHFGVKELAWEVGISKSQLLRKLKTLKNKSTSQFIREYRLAKANELLRQQVGTASEIAYRVGFSSPSYFSACFHEYFGYPPSEAKFHELSDHKQSITIVHEGNQPTRSQTKRNKRRPVLYSILLIGLLLITSFFIYNGVKKDTSATSTNILRTSTEEKSIAVLPFANMSGDPDFEYMSDGMTDAVISRLAKIHSIEKVVPFTTMSTYKETNKSIIEIASELGVTHLLEGNVQRSGDTVKIVLRLVDGKADTYDWSDDYKAVWDSEELFRMQAKVAENVASKMKAKVTQEESESIRREPTKNEEAYNLYLQAEYQRVRGDILSFENAVPLYEKAISLDLNYSDAHMGLAYVWMMKGLSSGISNEKLAWGKAKDILEKLRNIETSRKEAEYNLYMGYLFFDWDFKSVETYYQHQRNLPVFGDCSWLPAYAQKTGRLQEALKGCEEFIEWEPMVGKHYTQKAEILIHLRRNKEASSLLRHTDSLYSDNFSYLSASSLNHYRLGEYEKSRDQLDKVITGFTDRPPNIRWLNAMLLEKEGRHQEGEEQLQEILQLYEKEASGSPAYFIALYYCGLKDYDNAFAWLEKSYVRHEVGMTSLMETPDLINIYDDPRYRELYEKVGFSKVIPFVVDRR